MKIMINGTEEEIAGECTIRDLLSARNVESPDMVSVELNGSILLREEILNTKIRENDIVEFLYFLGGG
jgi:sulfur carrier protein